MFTGIIENQARLVDLKEQGNNKHLFLESEIASELKIDQSVAHNGVCLTVVAIENDIYQVTAIDETLKKSNLANLKVGEFVNIERCMPANGRFDGHMVYGHVDTTARCTERREADGSTLFTFQFDSENAGLIVEKGSVCLNGISLTIFDVREKLFTVAIIPYTLEHTNMKDVQKDTVVNIEFDILGKYIQRILARRN